MFGLKINDMITYLHIIYLFQINAIVEVGRKDLKYKKGILFISRRIITRTMDESNSFTIQFSGYSF